MQKEINEFIDDTKKDLASYLRAVKCGRYVSSESDQILFKKYISISSALIYEEFDSGSSMFNNAETYGFILKINPFSGIDSKGINALSKAISHEIPFDAAVQFINFASPEIGDLVGKWQNNCNSNEVYQSLTNNRVKFYTNGRKKSLWEGVGEFVLRNFELYVAVSFNKLPTQTQNIHLCERIKETRTKLSKALENIGCLVESIDKRGLNKFLGEILFPDKDSYKNISNIDSRKAVDITSDAEFTMYPDFVEVESKTNKNKYILFEIDEWPKDWWIYSSMDYVGYFQNGRGLPFPFYISFGFKSEDPKESERKTTRMRVIRTNQTTSKLVSFFPAMKEEVEDWHYVTEEIDKGARLAKATMHIVAIIGAGIDENSAAQIILDHFYQLGFKLNRIQYDCLNNLLYTLPMSLGESWNKLKRSKALTTMLTSTCLNLLPIFADSQNDQTPLMMFVGRRGQVFFFDNYAAQINGNYNMVVVGKSGSGKSVFLQEYMSSILRQDGQVVVIDDGRSFQNSCNLLGGDFVDFGGEDLCINPFSLYNDNAKRDEKFKVDFEEPLIDLIVSILCIVSNIDKNNTKNFSVGLYRDVLKKAVQIVLQEKGSQGGFKDVYETLIKSKNLRTDQTKDIAESLAYVLKEYASGRYSSYYNGKATLSIENLLTIFELSSLESNEVLQTSVLLMVVFLVYVKMQGRVRRTSLIIDEAWRLLRHDAIKGFIEGIARRARKYNGNLVVATQSISDFEENKSAAAAVLSQSDWRVLLSAEGKDEKILKDQLGMEIGEINIAKELKGDKGRYSEFMIRHSSGSWLIGRLILDPFSGKLYSSSAADVVEIQKLQKQGLTTEQAINQLIRGA